jgi:hypothetical protein
LLQRAECANVANSETGGHDMELEALANLGELVSAIAVVLSLIYLAVQIRQNTKAQRAESYSRALDRIATIQGRLSEDSQLADILLKGATDPRAMTPRERVQFTWVFYEMFGAFEFMFYENRNHSLSDDVWERWAATLLWWLAFPGVSAWWDARPVPFTPDFTRFIESRRSTERPDPEAHRRWSGFLSLQPD